MDCLYRVVLLFDGTIHQKNLYANLFLPDYFKKGQYVAQNSAVAKDFIFQKLEMFRQKRGPPLRTQMKVVF